MSDYRNMYYILCSAASEAIDRIESGQTVKAAAVLQEALYEAEDVYLRGDVHWGRRLWKGIKLAAPFVLGVVVILALVVTAFFFGGVFAIHNGFLP